MIAPSSTRRTFLLSCAVASVTAVSGARALASVAGGQGARWALFDPGFAPARAFALEAERQGMRILPVTGDLLPLWHEQLALLRFHQPLAIAGLTTPLAAVTMRVLAQGAGWRTALWGAHHGDTHAVEADAAVVASCAPLSRTPDWGAGLARAMCCPSGPGPRSKLRWASAGERQDLTSWMFMPRSSTRTL